MSVSAIWNVSDVLSCGLLYSWPSGENPATEIRLSPASRGLVDSVGRPTDALLTLGVFREHADATRL